MTGSPRPVFVALRAALSVSLAATALAVLSGVAAAAPKRIPQTTVFAASAPDGVAVGVSPRDEAATVVHLTDPPFAPTLVAKVRNAGGGFGPVQELTRSSRAELPRDLLFNSAGDLFLSWGVGSSSGQHAFRKAGSLFSAPQDWPGGTCARFQAVRYLPNGVPATVCSSVAGAGPNNNYIVSENSLNFEGTAYGIGQTLQRETNDNFLIPSFDIGPDGTRAVAWKTVTGSGPTQNHVIRLAVAPPGLSFRTTVDIASVVSSTGASLADPSVAVLADGRVAVTIVRFDGATATSKVLVRSASGTLTTETSSFSSTLEPSPMIVRDGDSALVMWHDDTGFATPATLRVGRLAAGPVVSGVQTLDSAVAGFRQGVLRISPGGTAAISRVVQDSGGVQHVGAWVRSSRTGSFSGPFEIGSAASVSSFDIALDSFGSVFAAWIDADGGNGKALAGGLDAAGPRLSGLKIPSRLKARRAGTFKLSASDPSGVKAISWSFGDRRSARGGSAKHSFRRRGRFRVTVSATDKAGQVTRITRTVHVVR